MDYTRTRQTPITPDGSSGRCSNTRKREYWWNNTYQYSQSSFQYVESGSSNVAWRTIADMGGSGRMGADNQCLHTVTGSCVIPYSITYKGLSGGWGWDTSAVHGTFRRSYPGVGDFATQEWGPMLAQFYSLLDPKGPVGFSLFQNLWELEQTMKMFKSLKRNLQRFNRQHIWGKQLSRPLAESKFWNPKRLSSGDLVKGAADNWLLYRYGIKPLVSDIVALATMVSNVQDRVNYVMQHREATDVVRVRESTTLPLSGTFSGAGPVTYSGSQILKKVIGAHVRWPNYYVNDAVMSDHILKYMGMENLLSNIWEVIPFSFVVDWFVDVGGALERQRKEQESEARFRNQVEILAPWHSVKVMQSIDKVTFNSNQYDCWLGWFDPSWTVYPITASLDAVEVQTGYLRDPSLPTGHDSPEILNGITLTHMLDGAALIAQYF